MWAALIPLLGNLLDKVIPDPQASAQAKLEVLRMAQQGELSALNADLETLKGQLEINRTEAASGSVFVAGWRPAVGWVCVLGLLYTFLVQPLLAWLSGYAHIPAPPSLPSDVLMTLLTGMLGLGGFRTFEKLRGVAAR